MIVIALALMAVFIGLMPLLGNVMISGQTIIIICAICATILFSILSYIISIKIYSKKEF